MSQPNKLRDDPGYWLCMVFFIVCPPMWLAWVFYMIWQIPGAIHERKLKRECIERGHTWGELHDHPWHDIARQYCEHCRQPNWEAQSDG